MSRRRIPHLATVVSALLLAGCGSAHQPGAAEDPPATVDPGPAQAAAASPSWTRFGYDAARTSVAPHGIAAARIPGLGQRHVALPGTVDASPIYLAGVRVGGARHDLLVMTTTYGRTVALDAATGRELWRFQPGSYGSVAGSPQITTATPVTDRRAVYAASPDGQIHKLRIGDGREVTAGAWPVSVTKDARHEKLAAALNLDGGTVLVTTGGYVGDAPPYQGKVVAIDRGSGRITSVFNSLCADRRSIIAPASCPASDSAIWARAGAVVDPADHHVLVATSNGPFDGRRNWGDSVLALSARAGRLLKHWTPLDQRSLEAGDVDIGSTAPALLPPPGGGRARFVMQGGKDGKLRLLGLSDSLHGVTGTSGTRLGGERQTLPAPGSTDVFSAIAVLHRRGLTMAFVTTGAGTAAFRFDGRRLTRAWGNATAGTSPVVAGGVLWIYDPGGSLTAYRPQTGAVIHRFSVPGGHWNSPIVAGGRLYLPTGDANDHSTSGELTVLGP